MSLSSFITHQTCGRHASYNVFVDSFVVNEVINLLFGHALFICYVTGARIIHEDPPIIQFDNILTDDEVSGLCSGF